MKMNSPGKTCNPARTNAVIQGVKIEPKRLN